MIVPEEHSKVGRRFIAGTRRDTSLGAVSPIGTTERGGSEMANTYYSLTIHYVFSTIRREPVITQELRDRLWSFMGGVLRQNKMKALCIGGAADHVHLLVSLPTTMSVAKAVQLVKGNSSKWVHDTFPSQSGFEWQKGYAAFSVSASHISQTMSYIKNQTEHHRTKTFMDEYLSFLKKHQIDYDKRYLWL